jgi:hypothetical protein
LPFCYSYCLFTHLFLSKQSTHARNMVSFYFFLFTTLYTLYDHKTSDSIRRELHITYILTR